MAVVLTLLLLLQADPTEQLRRQELVLRLDHLASGGRLDVLARECQRELRGKKIDPGTFDTLWGVVALRAWEERLPDFLAAWDKSAVSEAPAPAQALFRARLEALQPKSKAQRELLEAAGKRFPAEPAILWFLAKARFEAGERPAAAAALEAMPVLNDWPSDPDDYHRMLVVAYAESGRPAAAIEHLRALRTDRVEATFLAELALQSNLTSEAVRCSRLAVEDDPERMAHRVLLIRTLRADGDPGAALAERRRMLRQGDTIAPLLVEEYLYLLPAAGRTAEIHDLLRDVLLKDDPSAVKSFKALLLTVPPDDRPSVADAWEKAADDAPAWLTLARMKQAWGQKPEGVIDCLDKAEKALPDDPRMTAARFEPLKDLQRYDAVGESYEKLVRLDPDGKRTGPRPVSILQAAVSGLVDGRELGLALRLGVLALSDPVVEEEARAGIRNAMKPACRNSGPEFWDEIRKLKLASAPADVTAVVRDHVKRLSDDEFEVRAAASKELRKLGPPAIPVLLEHLDDPDTEVRSKAREIVRSILSD